MKKSIFALAAAVAVLAGCADKNAYEISINVPADFKGQSVALIAVPSSDTLNMATVEDTVVTFKGKIENPTLAVVTSQGLPVAEFIVEPGTITVTDGMPSGTPFNDQFKALTDTLMKDGENGQEIFLDFISKNPKNPITYEAIGQVAYAVTPEMIAAFIDANPDMANDRMITSVKQSAEVRATTSTGSAYKDFTLTQPDGKKVSLSEMLSKDSYTIVDFWASWCGPCRAEIPGLIKLYDTYRDKGLQVVGVDVWEKEEGAGQKAVADLGINYPVIYNGDNNTTGLYGIMGIPCILVIDKDGKIVARDIMGSELADFIANLYK